ncbi:MAG: hypothetical protein NTY01_09850 [Verrucomicrobia bacterium]|nr:hypothetical protein [Verrucomicrobiota bacterium]
MKRKRKGDKARDRKPEQRHKQSVEETESKFRRVLEDAQMRFFKLVRFIEGHTRLLEAVLQRCIDEVEKAGIQKLLNYYDEWLAEMAANVSSAAHIRAQYSENTTLLGYMAAQVHCGMEDLPDLLKRLPESEWEDLASSDCLGFNLLDRLPGIVRFLEKDMLDHPARYQLWAREQPALPMMVFRHRKAYERRFTNIAEAVQLGELCPIHSHKSANYDLTKPVNALVFETLMEFLRVLMFLKPGQCSGERMTPAEILKEKCVVPAERAPIFLVANSLPPLTKSTAYRWAYKAVIPYLEAEYPDWRKLPAVARYIKANGGRSKAREVIAEALEGMARPDSSAKPPSSRWPS